LIERSLGDRLVYKNEVFGGLAEVLAAETAQYIAIEVVCFAI
jgi:hypothetical protein